MNRFFRKYLIYIFCAGILLTSVTENLSSQQNRSSGIDWISIEDAVNKGLSEPRKLFIYIYSDNCGWCKRMNEVSFSDTIIISYINANYYPVKLNSSLSQDVILGSRTYKFIPADPSKNSPSYHELVVTLLNGRMAFPAISFISEKMEYMGVEFGFKNPPLLEAWLHFIGENEYLKTPEFSEFQKNFKGRL